MMNYSTEFLFQRTGDPFADTGANVIQLIQERVQSKDILQLIDYAANIYVKNWNCGIYTFFHNSTITLPTYKGEEKEATLKYFRRLLNDEEAYEYGYCRILGRHTKLFKTGRNNQVLVGSNAYINFHHGFQEGLKVAKEVIIRMFFIPLGSLQLGSYNAVIASNHDEVEKLFVTEVFIGNEKNISQGQSMSILKSEFKNPASALFDFANYCLSSSLAVVEREEPVEIHLYHFSNYADKASMKLYCFSERLFAFYSKVLKISHRRYWQLFVSDFYFSSQNQGAVYNSATDHYEVIVKKEQLNFGHTEYRIWSNRIYIKLLNNQSILSDFRFWASKKYQQLESFQIWPIVNLYQTQLKNMKKATLDKIREIADYLVEDEDKIKRRLTYLRITVKNNIYLLRRFLIQIIGDHYQSKHPNRPLITLEEYVVDLFPEGVNGLEIKDLLLIALYEKLCEKNIPIELEGEDDDSEQPIILN